MYKYICVQLVRLVCVLTLCAVWRISLCLVTFVLCVCVCVCVCARARVCVCDQKVSAPHLLVKYLGCILLIHYSFTL